MQVNALSFFYFSAFVLLDVKSSSAGRCLTPGLLTFPGEQLILHCDALPNCDDDEALIYWLVDGSFPEDARPLTALKTSRFRLMEGSILQKNLLLKNVTPDDFNSTFSCVVTNAVGMAQKFIRLTSTDCGGKQ
uniref:Ig-like domain-containing protein n=1 Tax=Fundulus heteroclitus TaxID=8078 RepID=A0A3Q2SRB4_FUNHE